MSQAARQSLLREIDREAREVLAGDGTRMLSQPVRESNVVLAGARDLDTSVAVD